VITGISAGRIPWPRCRTVEGTGGGSGLWLGGDLAKAVKRESAAAVMHWWRLIDRQLAGMRMADADLADLDALRNRLLLCGRNAARVRTQRPSERRATDFFQKLSPL
jgi:hypothetical protein